MDKKTVRDVIGEPESWHNHMNGGSPGFPDMKGAKILEIVVWGTDVGIHTKGAACGETFSVFVIADQELRERIVRVLRPGAEVHEATAATI